MGCIYFKIVYEWFCLPISSAAKYFSSLVQRIVIEDQLSISYTILKSETKKQKNKTILFVELLAVEWVPFILKHHLPSRFLQKYGKWILGSLEEAFYCF